MATKQPFPKTLGASIDLIYQLREQRLLKEKEAESMKEQEKALSEHIQQKFKASEIDGAKGDLATASLQRSTQADIDPEAWGKKTLPWIFKHKAWDLLQKRLSIDAVRARWAERVEIPGVKSITITKLSITKR